MLQLKELKEFKKSILKSKNNCQSEEKSEPDF
jgi:hypothetical protein